MIKRNILIVCLFTCISLPVFSQSDSTLRDNALRIFLDCTFCDTPHIKKELTFVNYVRDRNDGQVHILITSEHTGAGGLKQTFFFIGQQEYSGQADTLSFFLKADFTDDELRTKQLHLLKLGLVRYVAKTPYAGNLMVFYEETEDAQEYSDKWNNWFFGINGSVFFNGEQSYQSFSSYSSIHAQRITEALKVEFGLNYNLNRDTYSFGDTTIASTTNNKMFNHLLVKSMNNHWSVGYDMDMLSSLYQNLDFSARLYPAIEYNVFPYAQSSRKQLRILYGAGARFFNYIDTTIYNKQEELLFGQKLGIALELKEKWGSISTSVVGSHYFHDLNLKRLEVNSSVDLRLYKGLSLSLYGGVSLVHDQVNLPKGNVSSEDVLLRRKLLASQYFFMGSVGISYSFGSIFNNVVNPRFGR